MEIFEPVVAECTLCGALVSDTEKHEEFHTHVRNIYALANQAIQRSYNY